MKLERNKITFSDGNQFTNSSVIRYVGEPKDIFNFIKNHLSPKEQDELAQYMVDEWKKIKENAFINFLNK